LAGRYRNLDGKSICFIAETNQKYKIVNLPNWVGFPTGSPVNDGWYNAYTPKNPISQPAYNPNSSVIIYLSLTADSNGFANLNKHGFHRQPCCSRPAACDHEQHNLRRVGGFSTLVWPMVAALQAAITVSTTSSASRWEPPSSWS
jgi:hypothetical protein